MLLCSLIVVCVLDFTLPDNYPEVVPAIALSDAGRLTENQQTAVLNTLNIEVNRSDHAVMLKHRYSISCNYGYGFFIMSMYM